MSTGKIINPEAPVAEQRYEMKRIEQVSGNQGIYYRPALIPA